MRPLALGEVLSVSYFWEDRRSTTYSYAGKPREKPVNVKAMLEGKQAKKDKRAQQMSGLNKGKGTKRRAAFLSDITDDTSPQNINIPVSSKAVDEEPEPVLLTFQEVEHLNIDRLKEYYHTEKPKKLTLDWCDNAVVLLSYKYRGNEVSPFTLQGSTCRKVLKAEKPYE